MSEVSANAVEDQLIDFAVCIINLADALPDAAGMGRVDYAADTVEFSAEVATIFGFGESAIPVTRDQLHATFDPIGVEYVESNIQRYHDANKDGRCELDHRVVYSDGGHLQNLINDILDFSKIDSGKMELKSKLVRPDAIVGDARSLVDVRVSEKKLRLKIEFDGPISETIDIAWFDCDRFW